MEDGNLMSKLNINKKISKLISEVKDNENVSISTFFNDKDLNNLDHYYVFELNNQLKNLGTKSNGLFKEINEMLKEKQISLKDVINEEHQKKIDSNLLISNIFQDLKEFFEFSDEELLEKTSSTEKLLLEDKIYFTVASSKSLRYYGCRELRYWSGKLVELINEDNKEELIKNLELFKTLDDIFQVLKNEKHIEVNLNE